MKRSCLAMLVATLLAAAAYPVDMQLTVTKTTPLKGELEDLVTFGLLKEMTCDSNGNIFSPSNRKYGSALNSVVRFPHDASSFAKFSIDSVPGLERGTITDFELEPGGDLFVLARQVLKYSDVEEPLKFGKTLLIRYDQNGRVLSRLELKLNTTDFSPTGIAMLRRDEILVVGGHSVNGKTFVICQVFRQDGTLRRRFTLNPAGTKTSNGKAVRSTRVVEPLALKAGGAIYVLRGTTTEPIYVLSESAELVRTIQLKPTEIEFDSPKLLGAELVVQEHHPIVDQPVDPRTGPVFRQPQPVELPVFSLVTGKVVDRYIWHNESASLACAAPESLTFIGQDPTSGFAWSVFEASPGRHISGTNSAINSVTGSIVSLLLRSNSLKTR